MISQLYNRTILNDRIIPMLISIPWLQFWKAVSEFVVDADYCVFSSVQHCQFLRACVIHHRLSHFLALVLRSILPVSLGCDALASYGRWFSVTGDSWLTSVANHFCHVIVTEEANCRFLSHVSHKHSLSQQGIWVSFGLLKNHSSGHPNIFVKNF